MNTVLLIELGLLVLCASVLGIYLYKRRSQLVIQKLLAFGPFSLFSMALLKTTWGITLMDKVAKKCEPFIRIFSLGSIGVGFIGMILNVILLGAMIVMLVQNPQEQQVGLVLPFTQIPGLGFLAFSHWIVAIVLLATVHEFAHGVVARHMKVPIKASGIAALQIAHIPLIPAAFVEPDEKVMEKKDDVARYAILCAGPVSNILLAIPLGILLFFVIDPFVLHSTQAVGFSFAEIQNNSPAMLASVQAGTIYTYYNGKNVTTVDTLLEDLRYRVTPGDVVTIGYYEQGMLKTHDITTQANDEGKAKIGVLAPTNERTYTLAWLEPILGWIRGLFYWSYLFNILIGLMNLMPLFITDGGQILRVFLQTHFRKETALMWYSRICSTAFWIIVIAFVVPFVVKFVG